MPWLLANTFNDNKLEGSFNADGDQDSIDNDGVEGRTDVDQDLNDVFSFPRAYTTAQKYKVELLKIIYSTGAPNGAFESIMSWARSAVNAKYDFQPTGCGI